MGLRRVLAGPEAHRLPHPQPVEGALPPGIRTEEAAQAAGDATQRPFHAAVIEPDGNSAPVRRDQSETTPVVAVRAEMRYRTLCHNRLFSL
jgi:hypothetical protein